MTSVSTFWSPTELTSQSLEVYLLGTVDFDSALFLQERLVYEISGRDDRYGGLLVCEHPPMVTIGREGSRSDVICDPGELIARQIDVRWLNRGGGAFVHAPGQLAVYPIVPLERLQLGLAGYRERLEQAVVNMCDERHISAFRRDDQPGLWCRCGQFGFLGVAVKSWVAYHGLYINVSIDPELTRLVRPQSSGDRVTTLSTQSMRAVAMHKVRESLVRNVVSQLGYDCYHLYTGHPLLKRTKKRVHAYA